MGMYWLVPKEMLENVVLSSSHVQQKSFLKFAVGQTD